MRIKGNPFACAIKFVATIMINQNQTVKRQEATVNLAADCGLPSIKAHFFYELDAFFNIKNSKTFLLLWGN